MSKGNILFLRSGQSSLNFNTYNIQQIGMGKAFCDNGYNFDFVTFNKTCKEDRVTVFYKAKDCRARIIEKNRIRIFSMGVNISVLKKSFLEQYNWIICQEYYQIMTYFMSKRFSNTILYSGPYWNLFTIKGFSNVYDRLFTKAINNNIKYKFVKSILAKEYLEKKGYTNIIELGVALDTKRFESSVTMSNEVEKLAQFMERNRCLLYVGSLDANKNLPFLMDIYSELLITEPDIKMVLIGKSAVPFSKRLLGKSNDSYVKDIFSKYPSNIIEGIYRIDKIDNSQLKYIYPKAKVFLLPSKKEIFGMVLLEAMYLGAPVISSKNGGSCTLIKNERLGIRIDSFDVSMWVKAIKKYLYDDEYREAVISTAHDLIISKYSWEQLVNKILIIIGEKIEKGNN